ncbi:MAG: DUF4198 domain-containing protein [Pseudomonadota bacterium]|nr:DUF4198 domain-containing protein [Pseudomonadota bacterium]
MSVIHSFLRRRCRIPPGLAGSLGFAITIALFMAGGTPALAHEVWIQPHSPQVKDGAPVTADLRIGDMFVGNHLLYIPQQTERVAILGAGGMTDYVPRVGSRPVIDLGADLLDGLTGHAVLIYQSADSYVHYMHQDKFFDFVTKKGAADIPGAHARRGLPPGGFIERYKRFAKSSITIGAPDETVNDRATGMEVEFVLTGRSLMADGTRRLNVRLFYQGAPLPGAVVALFTRRPDGEVATTGLVTGSDGIVGVAALPGHDYLLDHVTIRPIDPATDKNKAVWESLWASLTFSGAQLGN